MPKSNLKTQAKRKRELAKLDKRHARDQKRAARKAEQANTADDSPAATPINARAVAVSTPMPAPPGPLTLAELTERWKSMRTAKPKGRG